MDQNKVTIPNSSVANAKVADVMKQGDPKKLFDPKFIFDHFSNKQGKMGFDEFKNILKQLNLSISHG